MDDRFSGFRACRNDVSFSADGLIAHLYFFWVNEMCGFLKNLYAQTFHLCLRILGIYLSYDTLDMIVYRIVINLYPFGLDAEKRKPIFHLSRMSCSKERVRRDTSII